MPQVSFINKSRTIKTYNLSHAEMCGSGVCVCSQVTLQLAEQLPDGTRGVREVPRLVSPSLILPVGEQSPPLPVEARNVRAIKRDLDARVLTLVEHADRPAVAEAPAQPVPVPQSLPDLSLATTSSAPTESAEASPPPAAPETTERAQPTRGKRTRDE